MAKRRIFVDFDGTLAEFKKGTPLEVVGSKGYTLTLDAIKGMTESVNFLADEEVSPLAEECEWYLLSAVLNKDCEEDKNEWVDKEAPSIKRTHRLFVPYGTPKSEFLKENGIEPSPSDILLDDFSENLRAWHGVGVKVLNGINNTHGTWRGFMLNGLSDAKTVSKALLGIIKYA